MNKKLVCLMLSILMLLTCILTGCGSTKDNEGGDEAEYDNSAKTITMWVITDDATTDTAKEQVSQAFTEITKAKFRTNVVLKFCTEAEYYEKLESTINAAQQEVLLAEEAARALRIYLKAHRGEKDVASLTADFYAENPQYSKYRDDGADEDEDEGKVEEETVVNEYGITEIKYPDEAPNQVDIFYFSGYDRYMKYYNDGWLTSLDEELATSSKKLTDYISTSLLQGAQIQGGVYAIPNNVPIGEYTYMLIDKTLFDTYYQKIDKVNSVLDLGTFLNDVKNYNGDKTPDDEGYVVPLQSTYEECMRMLCWYWDVNYTDQSVYYTHLDETTGRNYVVKREYEIIVETMDDEGNTKTENKLVIADCVEADVVYKTNASGQFLDADGNVLNYRYVVDNAGGVIYNEDNDTYSYEERASGGRYLVDEDGQTVTPENDKRVVIAGDTRLDSDGYPRPTYYYSINSDADFSILGTMMKDAADRNRGDINLGFNALFADEEYQDMYATLKNFEYQSFFGEAKEGQTAAVSFIKGDAKIKQAYEKNKYYVGEDGRKYYVVVAEYPQATEVELYGNMFGVYGYSDHVSRAMKVLTYLNTNKELRDLLQYGIENVHYERNKDGTVRLLSQNGNIYRMDLEKTGNCFIASPTVEQGADAWTYAKIQNNDSLINPLLGFDFNEATADSDYDLDVTLLDYIDSLNARALAAINDCATREELENLMTNSEDGFAKIYSIAAGDTKLNKAINKIYNPDLPLGPEYPDATPDKSGSSPYTVYWTWLTDFGYMHEE